MCYSVPYPEGFRDVLIDLDPTFHWLPQARNASI